MTSMLRVEKPQHIVDDGPRILAVVLGINSLALITIVARLIVRIKLIPNVGWDVRLFTVVYEVNTDEYQDYCMSFAMLLVIKVAILLTTLIDNFRT